MRTQERYDLPGKRRGLAQLTRRSANQERCFRRAGANQERCFQGAGPLRQSQPGAVFPGGGSLAYSVLYNVSNSDQTSACLSRTAPLVQTELLLPGSLRIQRTSRKNSKPITYCIGLLVSFCIPQQVGDGSMQTVNRLIRHVTGRSFVAGGVEDVA
ncbi:unnamed protein product [Arctogadus glacialis]